MKVITIAEMRALERDAIARGVTEAMMIEEVGRGIVDVLVKCFPRENYSEHTFYFFCGGGNNGADGRKAAEYLLIKGYRAVVIDATVFPDDDFVLSPRCVLIDAMLGIGSRKGIEGSYKAWIEKYFHHARCKIVAIDIPTGITGDEGAVDAVAVNADLTISCGFPKVALFQDHLVNAVGKIAVAPLTFSKDALGRIESQTEWINEEWVRLRYKTPSHNAHKHNRGRVHLIAGNIGTTGAANLMALGALASGAGLVTLWGREEVYPILASSAPPEVMVRPMVSVDRMLSEFISRSDAIGIGPGLGVDSLAEEIIGGLLNESRVPCLYDADALTVIAEKKWLGRMGKTAVVTPHWGEMLRLLNHRPSSRVEAAVAFCKSSQGCLVLKGPHTIVRQQGDEILFSYNSTGGYGLARGGSGDVLAGVTAGLLAQGYSPTTAARIGAWVHGRAADELSIDKGDLGWSLMDLINQIRLQWRLIQ